MTPEEENEILRSIIKRSRAPMWWARLSYPTNDKFWNEIERELLLKIFGRSR